MANVNISPNMLLPVPVPTQDPGPDWANNIYACLYSQLDAHDHSSNKGVQITPAGMNINVNLPFQSNSATGLLSTSYTPQSSPLSAGSFPAAVYVSGVDLFYNDTSGHQIQITSGGAVNATSSGISSGTATASFVSSVLVVNANTNTPANIQGGSIFLGNNVVNSKYLELSPPNAMAANYQLILPSLPASPSFLQVDTSGNITASPNVTGGLTTSNFAANSVTAPIRNSANFLTGGIPSGGFSTNSTSLVDVTGLTVTIASNPSNKKYAFIIQSSGLVTMDAGISLSNQGAGTIDAAARIILTGTVSSSVSTYQLAALVPNVGAGFAQFPSIFMGYYTPATAGETFKIQTKANNGSTSVTFSGGLQLVAIEQV